MYELQNPDTYRSNFLSMLHLDTWNDEKVNLALSNIYHKIKDNEQIQWILNYSKCHNMSQYVIMLVDSEQFTIFTNMLQIHTFNSFHKCILDVLKFGKVSERNLKHVILEIDSYKY